jgi:hypothetical protein
VENALAQGTLYKATTTNKLVRLGHIPPASQAGRLGGPVFFTLSFLWQ